jgi:hypothetical protein
MRILNDIPCKLNSIGLMFNSISISKKWDANWYIRYCKSTYNYCIEKQTFEKYTYPKNTFSSLFIWELAKQILVWHCLKNDSSKNDLWNLKLSYVNELLELGYVHWEPQCLRLACSSLPIYNLPRLVNNGNGK